MNSVGFDCTDLTKGQASQTILELEAGEHDGGLGLETGVANLCLPVSSARYHSLFVEMKTDASWISKAQEMRQMIFLT